MKYIVSINLYTGYGGRYRINCTIGSLNCPIHKNLSSQKERKNIKNKITFF
jgi:hypothetical protein